MHTDAVAGSVVWSALAGVLPLIAFFVLLMGFKLKAHWSALGAVAVGVLIAIALFGMPAPLVGLSLAQGIAFGLFPIVYIIIMAVWMYDLTVTTGRFEDLRQVFSAVGRGDMRVQALLIGFAFGGLLEALAGFGAPVAIVAAMLLAIGMKPLTAIAVTLLANAAPVAFGAMAIPVTTAAGLAGLDPASVAAMTGRQVSVVAFVVPFILCFVVDGMRGLRQVWPFALVLGLSFGGGQFLASNYFAYELTDVVACLLSLGLGLAFLRVWEPTTPPEHASQAAAARLTGQRIGLALFPYLLIVVVFAVTKLWRIGVDIPAALAATDIKIHWPGLYGKLLTESGEPSTSPIFTFNWLSTPGTILFICGLITVATYTAFDGGGRFRLGFGRGFATLAEGVARMRWSYVTIAVVMGLAYVMNFSGQTAAIGALLAATGAAFPAISPVLGWLGTAVTASATSSNALFAQMQATTAGQVGVDPSLLVGANTTGATIGKMVSPQTAAIASGATNTEGTEGKILGMMLRYSVGLVVGVGLLVFLQSTPVLGWMVPVG